MSSAFIQKIFPPNLVYRNFIFIPLFFVFYIVFKIFEPSVFLLKNFNGRNISIATFEGIDIGARVLLFYKAIGFALVLLFLLTRIVIIIKNYFNTEELLLANGISLAGFCLLFFQLLGADMSDSIHFIFAMLIICLSGFVSHLIKKRYTRDFTATFLWTILIAASLFFLQWQISIFTIGKNILSFPKILVITGVPLYLFYTNRSNLNYKLLKVSKPFIFIPLLSFIAIEFYMILNQRGYYLSPKIIYVIGLVIIFFMSFMQYRKSGFLANHKSLLSILFKNWMPLVVAGVSCIAFYEPIIKPDIDWFEDANHILPLHQLFSFGKIPFLDSFTPHGLSYFGFGLLYSFINGADPMGVFIYHFLLKVFVSIIIYLFIYKISGDGFIALWIVLAFPYTDLLFPSYFNLVPLMGLAFISLYEKQSLKRYVFFFCLSMFMILWRIDIGFSTLIAGGGSLLFLILFVPSFKTNRKNLFNGFAIAIIILLSIFIMSFLHSGKNIFISFKDVFEYLSSAQSYGNKDLSLVLDIKYYSLYFIFPIAIFLILIHCIYQVVRHNKTNEKIIFYNLAIIFLGLFYFSNLQRGIIRHTLAEGWDSALTSYGFFIIVSIVLIKLINKNSFIRFFILFVFSTLLISNYVYSPPDLRKNNLYNSLTMGLNNPFSIPSSKEKIHRIIEVDTYKNKYADFSHWMKNNFSDKSTFLDFSNTPMLYYYTKRIVPDYFVQIPHTAHNEYLQNRFLSGLKNYEIPVVIFSNVPLNFWDNLDGIPNTLRHYRLTEYIYRNYSPAYIIDNRSIWVDKKIKLNVPLRSLFTTDVNIDNFSTMPLTYSLKWIPYTWGTFDKNFNNGKIEKIQTVFLDNKILFADREIKYPFLPIQYKDSGNYILIKARTISAKPTEALLNYGDEENKNGSFSFTLKNDSLIHSYLIRVSSQYNWYCKTNSWLSLYPVSKNIILYEVAVLKGD